MRIKNVLILVAAIGQIAITVHAATPTAKEEYELQARCGQQSRDEFTKEFGNGIINTRNGQDLASFKNHYNKRLNKCFYLLRYASYTIKGKNAGAVSELIWLWDLNENNEIGTYTGSMVCQVAGVPCKSKAEWDALVKPYMSD